MPPPHHRRGRERRANAGDGTRHGSAADGATPRARHRTRDGGGRTACAATTSRSAPRRGMALRHAARAGGGALDGGMSGRVGGRRKEGHVPRVRTGARLLKRSSRGRQQGSEKTGRSPMGGTAPPSGWLFNLSELGFGRLSQARSATKRHMKERWRHRSDPSPSNLEVSTRRPQCSACACRGTCARYVSQICTTPSVRWPWAAPPPLPWREDRQGIAPLRPRCSAATQQPHAAALPGKRGGDAPPL